jgi:hypothetical protein
LKKNKKRESKMGRNNRRAGSAFGRNTTLGEMYSSISITQEDFEGAEEGRSRMPKMDPFVKYCKDMHRKYPNFARGQIPDAQREAIDFLGWRITPGDFNAAVKGTFMQAIIPIAILIAVIFAFGMGFDIGDFNPASYIGGAILLNMFGEAAFQFFMIISLMLVGIAGMAMYFVYSYPIGAANKEKNLALTYVPEIVGYMIMSMKLVPNLEKAIEFSAKHGKGKVADDFKKILWDFQLGVYNSVAEGLDALAYRWGTYSPELKEALMRIRACVLEPEESKRYQLLDKTMLNVLDGVKSKLEEYARGLSQPSVTLFYMGVLLPLILIIILPVGSAFSGAPLARPEVLLIIYCGIIPAMAFFYAKSVVEKRPPTYEPPIIPDRFAGLPPKWALKTKNGHIDSRLVFLVIVVFGILISYFVSTQGIPPKFLFGEDDDFAVQLIPPDKSMEELMVQAGNAEDYFGKKTFDLGPLTYPVEDVFYELKEGTYYKQLRDSGLDDTAAEGMVVKDRLIFVSSGNDPTKYLFWSGVILSLVGGVSFILYYGNIYKRRAQLEIMAMEDEFKESMYLIASRMGENKPVENALKHARDFLPNLVISRRIFGKTLENIELLGMPLEAAVFDPAYGALKGIPSDILKTSMRLLVDSVSLGVNVASRTLMSLSLQMENMDKVNKSLKDMVAEITGTMQTMALFIAPMVLGVTTALQKVVMNTLAGVISDPSADMDADLMSSTGQTPIDVEQLFKVNPADFQTFASPLQFLIIISIYVIMIVIIMTYFTTKVQEDNDLLVRINLAKALPIAVTMYVLSVLASNMFIATIM